MKLNKITPSMVNLKNGMEFDLDRSLSNAIQGINNGNISSFTVDASLNNPLVELSSTFEDGTVSSCHLLDADAYKTKPEVVSTESSSCIKCIETENTGGGCMVDVITLGNDMVVTISDECLVVHPNMQSWYDQRPEQNCMVFSDIQEAEDKRIQAVKAEVLSNMAKLLENWCDSQNLEYLPADAVLAQGGLTEDQQVWLQHYITMWNLSE